MYSLTNNLAPELHSSLRGVVKALQHEIDELVPQKIAVATRIRNLRQQLRQKQVSRHKSLVSGKIGLNLRNRRRSHIATIDRSRETMNFSHDNLKRACRIALMEAGGAANAERIYSLIVRRGSFVFGNPYERALHSVISTLNIMHEAGELSLATDDQTSRARPLSKTGVDYTHEPESIRSS